MTRAEERAAAKAAKEQAKAAAAAEEQAPVEEDVAEGDGTGEALPELTEETAAVEQEAPAIDESQAPAQEPEPVSVDPVSADALRAAAAIGVDGAEIMGTRVEADEAGNELRLWATVTDGRKFYVEDGEVTITVGPGLVEEPPIILGDGSTGILAADE